MTSKEKKSENANFSPCKIKWSKSTIVTRRFMPIASSSITTT